MLENEIRVFRHKRSAIARLCASTFVAALCFPFVLYAGPYLGTRFAASELYAEWAGFIVYSWFFLGFSASLAFLVYEGHQLWRLCTQKVELVNLVLRIVNPFGKTITVHSMRDLKVSVLEYSGGKKSLLIHTDEGQFKFGATLANIEDLISFCVSHCAVVQLEKGNEEFLNEFVGPGRDFVAVLSGDSWAFGAYVCSFCIGFMFWDVGWNDFESPHFLLAIFIPSGIFIMCDIWFHSKTIVRIGKSSIALARFGRVRIMAFSEITDIRKTTFYLVIVAEDRRIYCSVFLGQFDKIVSMVSSRTGIELR